MDGILSSLILPCTAVFRLFCGLYHGHARSFHSHRIACSFPLLADCSRPLVAAYPNHRRSVTRSLLVARAAVADSAPLMRRCLPTHPASRRFRERHCCGPHLKEEQYRKGIRYYFRMRGMGFEPKNSCEIRP
jgi:hypothetical protein